MEKRNKMLPLIAAFKLGKACLLFLLAFGFRHLRLGNAQQILENWANAVRIDQHDHFIRLLTDKISDTSSRKLHELGIFVFCYGVLFAIEGIGLLLELRWAEYVTIISTALFLPMEIYELVHRPNHKLAKAVVLVINLAILVYLIIYVRRKQRPGPDLPPQPLASAEP